MEKLVVDKINKIISALAEANNLKCVIDKADFNDKTKLGDCKNSIKIFNNLELDGNTAEGNDILGNTLLCNRMWQK
ncbi:MULTISPECIES: hypothetical protein [Sulfurospirillum]|uniref:Uncharacterized protein n=4 Tax=Sulfurospirillum TaxID=57665 RepID=A0A1Y0HL44_9BACT|nr:MULTISPECIES: hypothetical protein [Sulfurospirillum]AHJ12845.1 hypothetical protein SMUL_1585 [Sulfurospirillum multivorans DSM 12446]AOO65321.1 hypothetical protein SHALO_1546 [Sulfurospirillum halorespirans DSM 13726]ARU48802.1 hypothetical protein Sdiek1_1639 [Sulfurospirillum diekertiae]ASC93623.1 hypothetical protein Sdiek2_1605 [Sulfurospirillum diekertiae]ATB69667.1 hypothetical protein SJPD1_1558 [Sulfurospirillum diekertiae]